MPIENPRAGRIVPASVLDFSRYSKNLAWLLECQLHVARELLTDCYGFGSVHELQACIPAPGDQARPTGPFEDPRARPSFFSVAGTYTTPFENRLAPLSPRERQLVSAAEQIFYKHPELEGRLRRRYLAVLDSGFFSAPSVHRKKFAEVKAGILAMEGSAESREAYLEAHWPPAFWSFLEWTQLHGVDAREGLSKLKDSSLYYDAAHVMSIADIFHSTAAHRAPAVYLEMVTAGDGDNALELPDYSEEWFEPGDLPLVHPEKPGLFALDDDDYWGDFLDSVLPEDIPEHVATALYSLTPQAVAVAAPPGTPERVRLAAQKWRLHQLRALSKRYVEFEYNNRYMSGMTYVHWPDVLDDADPAGLDDDALNALRHAMCVSGVAPGLALYAEMEEHGRSDNDEATRQLWRFKALLTRLANDEPEDVVGYMTGWFVGLASDEFVCDQEMLLEDASYDSDGMLQDGLNAFVNAYLPYAGVENVLKFVNTRWHSSVTITEIVLRPEYRQRGLLSAAFSAFNQLHVEALFSATTTHPADANFDADGEPDPLERPPEVDLTPPGVFMVPVPPRAKRLEGHLLSTTPVRDDEMDNVEIDVFPFRAQSTPGAIG